MGIKFKSGGNPGMIVAAAGASAEQKRRSQVGILAAQAGDKKAAQKSQQEFQQKMATQTQDRMDDRAAATRDFTLDRDANRMAVEHPDFDMEFTAEQMADQEKFRGALDKLRRDDGFSPEEKAAGEKTLMAKLESIRPTPKRRQPQKTTEQRFKEQTFTDAQGRVFAYDPKTGSFGNKPIIDPTADQAKTQEAQMKMKLEIAKNAIDSETNTFNQKRYNALAAAVGLEGGGAGGSPEELRGMYGGVMKQGAGAQDPSGAAALTAPSGAAPATPQAPAAQPAVPPAQPPAPMSVRASGPMALEDIRDPETAQQQLAIAKNALKKASAGKPAKTVGPGFFLPGAGKDIGALQRERANRPRMLAEQRVKQLEKHIALMTAARRSANIEKF